MQRKNIHTAFQRRTFALVLFCFALAFNSFAQKTDTPGKIAGYKIQKANILIQTSEESAPLDAKDKFDSLVRLGKPQNFRPALTGATFEVPISMLIFKTSGTVESISFENAKVNGLKMQVEELKHPFDFQKGAEINLPKPLKVKVALRENVSSLLDLKPSLDQFEVSGRVLIFGTFKKFGLKFKRVIPVDFKFKVKFALSLSSRQ